ncbi:MAG TPA: DUF4829 domain-containing protein [Anaerolineae bacterium]|nr:DUF4829 domain-containing protein [Anaerolineae bacterium]
MKRVATAAALVLLSLLLVGCATGSSKRPALNNNPIEELTPWQLVETYYKSLAARDYATARACLSPEYASEIDRSDDSDFKNLWSISNLVVSKEANIKLYGKNYDEVQVVAEYDATYKKIITAENGRQIRFLYVARKSKDSPWRIISIGTGP